ncbi:MAG: alkaline phosphatase family protein [Flavobacteriaceae bacterium]
MKALTKNLVTAILVLSFTLSCENNSTDLNGYQTRNVIIVVIDGPRYSETWGDPSHQHIPRMANELAAKGVVYTNFYNNGPTYTNAGHTAITTGHYQEIHNGGLELPQFPSIFQHWSRAYAKDSTANWIIASKDKLEVLSDCIDEEWNGQYKPATNCGNNGLGSGYREDNTTYDRVTEILSAYQPQLVLINFKAPDTAGHANNWSDYLEGIMDTDEYIYDLWNFIETDSFYQGTTTLFVTNDHGRHLDEVADGFVSHGDDCEGCRHINLFACGPDFKQGTIIEIERQLIDIPVTIAELLEFEIPNGDGEVMHELMNISY